MAKTKQKVQMPTAIRRKMSAAISMLLVACIMLVGSTYAWFTLSTAPEVKGITTKVGANGNLEIALLNKDTYKDTAKITTNEGDSMDTADKSVLEANVTWGNLVDLNDSSYGLNNISLAPAELNVSSFTAASETNPATATIGNSLLRTPEYGSDGRVAKVSANTVTGVYETNAFKLSSENYGVRAIGTASGLTDRQIAYRNAISNITTYTEQAKAKAKASLETYGDDLATIVIGIVSNTSNFDSKYKTTFQGIVDTISEANDAIENSIKQATIAYAMRKGSEINEESANIIASNISGVVFENYVASNDIITALETASTVTLSENLKKSISVYVDTANRVKKAQGEIDNLNEATDISSNQLNNILSYLINTDLMTVCGVKVEGVNKEDLISAIISNYGKGIEIEMPTDSGVYSNISDACGNYTVQVDAILNGNIGGVNFNNNKISAYMKTKSITVVAENGTTSVTSDYYLTTALSEIQKDGEPEGTTTDASPITDTYGYALDFAFRTNAAGANLMLQTAEKQRVYSDSVAHGTQGAGSYMEFTASDNFSVDAVTDLMGAIRVAFVNGTKVLGMAKLDMEHSTVDNKNVKAGLYMYDYTYTVEAGAQIEDGVLNLNKIKDTSTISSLQQNTAEKITVIVYLDGNVVDNSMVANAKNSMSGKLNLQFTTDATLTPMENSALRNAKTKGVTLEDITSYLSSDAIEAVKKATGATSVTIYKGSDNNYYYSTDGNEDNAKSLKYEYIKAYLTNSNTVPNEDTE